MEAGGHSAMDRLSASGKARQQQGWEEWPMKWFKHETDSIRSEKQTRLINEFGFAGYGRFWRIMEIVAERMDESDRCHAELPEKEWHRLLIMKRSSFNRYLVFIKSIFDNWQITTDSQTRLIRIKIPNLLKKRDNYTKNLQATNKNLANRSRGRKDVDVEEEVKTLSPQGGDGPLAQGYINSKTENPSPPTEQTKKIHSSVQQKLSSNVNVSVDTKRKKDSSIALEAWVAAFMEKHGYKPMTNPARDHTILKRLVEYNSLDVVLRKIPHHIALNNYQSIPGFESCFNSLGLKPAEKKSKTRMNLDKLKVIKQKLIEKEMKDERRRIQQRA
jgi:hypothetical protein